jgi:hypothetical protein
LTSTKTRKAMRMFAPRRGPLASFEIEGLIRLKVLPKAHREDADALQAAVLTLVYQALDGAG